MSRFLSLCISFQAVFPQIQFEDHRKCWLHLQQDSRLGLIHFRRPNIVKDIHHKQLHHYNLYTRLFRIKDEEIEGH